MTTDRHSHSDLIDAVGAGHVRLAFGLKPQGLYMWRLRGIPVGKRLAFAELAAIHGAQLPTDFLADMRLPSFGRAA